MIRIIVAIVLALSLAACASNRNERTAASLQRYEAAAGEPVKSFSYFSIHSWTPLGREHLAIWTRPREGYLIHVRSHCPDLDFAQHIGISSSLSRVYARFDSVLVGPYTCRIDTIRPVNVDALRDLQREARRSAIEMKDSGKARADSEM